MASLSDEDGKMIALNDSPCGNHFQAPEACRRCGQPCRGRHRKHAILMDHWSFIGRRSLTVLERPFLADSRQIERCCEAPATDATSIKLPSSSPAYASVPYAEKLRAWEALRKWPAM